jgi:acyl-coenzyme A thioesterase PaaI-like protein
VTAIDPDRLAAVRADYAHCFGCGLDNHAGLRIDGFQRDGVTVAARFRPGAQHRGFRGILHGGIVATALDEILAWTAILVARTMAVTATLDLKYRAPAPGDAMYRLEGTLVEQRGRRMVLSGHCSVGDKRIAEARGLFLATEPVEL